MASTQTRKRKSDQMATPEVTTPTGSPAAKKMRITQSQKQALIDNLQLEVTERARRLRAQYALQCKDLRTRIERRINRIPMAMRNMTMAELIAKHDQPQKAAPEAATKVDDRPLPPVPQPLAAHSTSPLKVSKTTTAARSKKRKSSEIHIASDKENDVESNTSVQDVLPVQKNAKRAKTANTVAKNNPRAGGNRGGVLSPRSHNSRTLPRSPIKDRDVYPQSPAKQSYIARPVSPLKSASPFKSAASAATSAISASVHGMLESARQRGAAALASSKSVRSAGRNASKDSTAAMPPPATTKSRAVANRAVSQMSNHSASTDVSTSSHATDTTVITKPARGRTGQTTAKPATNTTSKAKKATVTKAAAKATTASVKKAAATTTTKKSAATTSSSTITANAEATATGRRILRKRN